MIMLITLQERSFERLRKRTLCLEIQWEKGEGFRLSFRACVLSLLIEGSCGQLLFWNCAPRIDHIDHHGGQISIDQPYLYFYVPLSIQNTSALSISL